MDCAKIPCNVLVIVTLCLFDIDWWNVSALSALTQQNVNKHKAHGKEGKVMRIAARKYHPQNSKPSSREYTTRKDEFESLSITKEGCVDDYNHYRTMALESTPDRAISLLTCDVMTSLRATYPKYKQLIQDGDLGENILIDGVSFGYFKIGKQYCIDSLNVVTDENNTNTTKPTSRIVVLEITEPIEPCANLCKLPYINDDSMTPKDRIQRCQEFIAHLDRFDGYRGWYAKVVEEGIVKRGASIFEIHRL
jgi:MOSC domain-containing protein YiiM